VGGGGGGGHLLNSNIFGQKLTSTKTFLDYHANQSKLGGLFQRSSASERGRSVQQKLTLASPGKLLLKDLQ